MSDPAQPSTSSWQPSAAPAPRHEPAPPSPGPSADPAPTAVGDRPEVLMGAAFVGGLTLALILKRLGS